MDYWFLRDSLSEIRSIVVGEPVTEVAVEIELVGVCPWTAKLEGCNRFGSGSFSLETFMLTFILQWAVLDQFHMLQNKTNGDQLPPNYIKPNTKKRHAAFTTKGSN